MSHRRKVQAARAIALVVGLAFLELGPRLGWVDRLTLVPLSEVLRSLHAQLVQGKLSEHLGASAVTVVTAFGLAVLTGVPGGLLLWRLPRVRAPLEPYLASYYAVPVFALYPLLISLLGMGYLPIVAIAWGWSVVAVVVNTAVGFTQVRPVYRKLAVTLRLTPWQTFRHILFPAAAPYVFNGIKLAVTYSVIGVIASEFILAPRGLGWLISYHYNNFSLREMYAALALVLVLATGIYTAVGRAERAVRRRAG